MSSPLIEKLGHKILEIRERALFNIVSKFENRILFDDDLAKNKELLTKLFQWFLFEPCTQKQVVFSLLKDILKSKSGRTLINHYGKSSLKMQICQMRSYLESKYYTDLDELCELIDEKEDEPEVPPLETDIPLSYRTNSTNNCPLISPAVGTTATAIEGYIQKESFAEEQIGIQHWSEKLSSNNFTDGRSFILSSIKKNTSFVSNFYLNWQPLIEPDRHVLQSVENSLKDPPQSSALLSSCEFFTNILLHDFPAEIFLQRPAIVLEFYSLMMCGSIRLTNAVLNALCNLTKLLQIRIHYCKDISLQNFRSIHLDHSQPVCNSPRSERNSEPIGISHKLPENLEKIEDILLMEKNQLSFPKYGFITLTKVFEYLCMKQDEFGDNKLKLNKVGINFCLILLEEVFQLLCLCFGNEIWDSEQNEESLVILKEFNELFIQYGEALEYFRVKFMISETKSVYRIIYLYLIHNTTMLLQHFVPLSEASMILPRNLKSALSNSLLDVILGKIYPEVYSILLNYVKSICVHSEVEPLRKYEQVLEVCNGLSATVLFLKQHKYLSINESLKAAKEALPSMEFHMNFDFLKIFVDMCSSKFCQISDNFELTKLVEEIVLNLLSHNLMEIREEMYRLCHRIIIKNIGPEVRIDSTGSQILFLLLPNILINISVFGMTSENLKVTRYAEDIVLYIIKCQTVVSEAVWNKIVQALIPSLPIVICHAKKNSPIGKAIITLLDPDRITENFIPPIVMLKCNVEFLFAKETYLREEAFSRICWLLTSQKNSGDLLPKFNTVYDTALANVCYLKTVVDINKTRFTDHFYQPTSLRQVLEVVNSENIEPVLKRSALNQVNVMVEDPLLHQVFLEDNGVEIVVDTIKSALTEKDYRNYPDSIVPVISILKNICLHHSDVREELSMNVEVFYFVLRGLFLFFTEERVRQDAGTLLCLLIFKDFVRGTPKSASFSLPNLICVNMHLPFLCNSHWNVSDYTRVNLKEWITSDSLSLSSVQIQWNLEIFGGFQEIIKRENVTYDDEQFKFSDELKLSNGDLKALKTSSVHFCIMEHLNMIQNGTSHNIIIESIEDVTMCVYLYKIAISTCKDIDDEYFLSHSWEQTFSKFLKSLPSCNDDMLLLRNVIQLLAILVPFYKLPDKECWIITILKDNTQCLLDLLNVDSTSEENKIIGQELLKLITVCACQEQHYLDFYTANFISGSKPWTHIIKITADILKFNNSQHFYNLAYLDFLLLCLVHLTATLGWSSSKLSANPKETMDRLVSSLCELIGAFHCGKGSSAAVSLMGLSITRHVLLILNNLVAELQNSKTKFWEKYFLDDGGGNFLNNFLTLWTSRDVIVRAGALQLFSGLATSPRAAEEIVSDVKPDGGSILNSAFSVLVDTNEANIVREYAAQLIANLVAHMAPASSNKVSQSNALFILKKNHTNKVLSLLEEFDIYSNLEVTLNNLFTTNISQNAWVCHSSQETCSNSISSTSQNYFFENTESTCLAATPGFVKCFGLFLYNVLNIAPEDITNKLQECGLVKLLFRSLCNPSMSISNPKELSLYCDILEMNTAICSVLIKLTTISPSCLGTILHTSDCFSALISLLNYKNFHTNKPQLMYLRNSLWAKIFKLLTTLIESASAKDGEQCDKSVEVLTIFYELIFESKSQLFLETICESVSCLGSNELQNYALTFLTSLLKTDFLYHTPRKSSVDSNTIKTVSLQNILDSVRTTRSVVICSTIDRTKNDAHSKKHGKTKDKQIIRNKSSHKTNLLEEAYFGQVFPKLEQEASYDSDSEISFVENNDNSLSTGAKLCKILLHLYDISNLRNRSVFGKIKENVTAALASLLCISVEAKKYALENHLLNKLMKQLKEKYIQLSLESVDCLRRITNKRNVCPLLNDVNNLVRLLTNFMINNGAAKIEASALNLADIIHKLWVWFLMQNSFLIDVLRLLNVYSTECSLGCQSMTLTSSVAGSGPGKVPTNDSLLHALITLIIKEMEQFSKMHDLSILNTSFNILCNCCESLECRILIAKSSLFNGMLHLHPAKTKKQKPWDSLELVWLGFLENYTIYPEGQTSVAKASDVLELVMSLAFCSRPQNKLMAVLVLRNIAFYQPNKSRLLSSGEFLNILQAKLMNGTFEEKNAVVTIIWAMAANNQKAKKIFKSAHLDVALDDVVKHYRLLKHETSSSNGLDLNRINVVLSLLRSNK
ncbi:rotatin [Anoplophora glabripennis]|uniref:rotatin n=1 Tax=Anoplophora glabripennis TaxID=217634 RepID=UPI000873FFB9|nr:rotatin [Anoplophora glabripennis]